MGWAERANRRNAHQQHDEQAPKERRVLTLGRKPPASVLPATAALLAAQPPSHNPWALVPKLKRRSR